MLIAGLTGGLACGKSFVAQAFADLGCHIVEADQLGHEVLLPDGEAYGPAVALFGKEILNQDGTINRQRLGLIVFNSPGKLAELNAIVHPAVQKRARRMFDEIAQRDPDGIVIYVAAILVETGGWRDYDKLIVADCSRETQIRRAVERFGATPQDVEARLSRQLPAERKREVADFVIDTNGAKEDTLRQTKMVLEQLRSSR
ncbi:MAG TPA: dephospho-CoA kinase [Bryobacteraceae bacterium]|nr:dephospho-CoA kinase [Bryobacteraceae bacterium]